MIGIQSKDRATNMMVVSTEQRALPSTQQTGGLLPPPPATLHHLHQQHHSVLFSPGMQLSNGVPVSTGGAAPSSVSSRSGSSASGPGGGLPPASLAEFAPNHQALYLAQQQHPMNTPWTLCSTDGTFATQVAMLQHQQQMEQYTASSTASSAGNKAIHPIQEGVPSPTHINSDPDGPVKPQRQGVPIVPATGQPAAAAVSGAVTPRSLSKIPTGEAALALLAAHKSLYQDLLFRQPSAAVEAVLAAGCEVMGFDIAEMWLRTGSKTHQLTNSHLRPTALQDSVRKDLVDVYYGEKSSDRTHRLSPALCKRAREANDVVWVTAHTPYGAEALRASISNVRTAVAVPICHEGSNTNITIIFFSMRRIVARPTSIEFLVHISLSAGVAAVNNLAEDGLIDRDQSAAAATGRQEIPAEKSLSHSEHVPGSNIAIRHQRMEKFSVTGARLDLQWRQLHNVEYLTDGGNSWIHTAVFNGRPVVAKTLKPECQDVVVAINEIEGELAVHSRLNHPNIVDLIGAGTTSRGVRFVVLERLDGGTLTQMLGYDTRIRDRRRRFWKKKQSSFLDVLRTARSIALAMKYCHEDAVPGCVVLHRDLKPDNIGFTLDGTVKIMDFGLARILENASVESSEVYSMSGETGSLRYMAPEVADALPYNHSADVYSFGIILWELNSSKKPFEGLNRELFYERIVHGGERPPLSRKWPKELTSLMSECWDEDMQNRPRFRDIVRRLDAMIDGEKGGKPANKKPFLPKISGMIDRHSTWF